VKNKIIYIGSFLAAFIIVTTLIIALNNSYNNIFEFDFTEVKPELDNTQFTEISTSAEVLMLKSYLEHEFKDRIVDSVKANTPIKIDTVIQKVVEDKALIDSLNRLNVELQKTQKLLAQTEKQVEKNEKVDTVDKDWIRKTSKLLEEMDPKRAAKVITNYSDNEARELIYAMKQKKAAEILSLLDPVFVNKITSSQI